MTRIRLLPCLLLLCFAPFSVVAQDKPEVPELDSDIELMKLFTVEGRSWSHKVIEWTRGESPYVLNESMAITGISEDEYEYERSSRSADGTSESHESGELSLTPTGKQKWYADKRLPIETLDMGFREFECRKHREEIDGSQVTTWVSTEYHPLIVKQTRLGKTATHIRKLTGFNTAETDPYLLYRKEGRSWTLKSTTTIAGMDPLVSHTRQTVTEVGDDYAMVQLEILDKDKEPMAGMANTDPMRIEFVTGPAAVATSPAETVYETKECEAGEFDCARTEMAGGTFWGSTVWPGLSVAYEMESTSSELIEFDLGHDADAFYRTEGNYYETRMTIDTGFMKTESTHRCEVIDVDETGADYVRIYFDDGKETSRKEARFEFAERKEGESLAPYEGQIEELIDTPCGPYPTLRIEIGKEEGKQRTTIWHWNGIDIRIEAVHEEGTSTVELTDIHIQ